MRPTIEGNLRGFDPRSSTRLGKQAAERDTKLGRLEQAVPLDGGSSASSQWRRTAAVIGELVSPTRRTSSASSSP